MLPEEAPEHLGDRFACTNHVLGNGCDNARTIAREALEAAC
jgi:hypothetical protein